MAKLPEISIPLNPDSSHFKNEVAPVENISWVDAIEFCDRLSNLTGRNYRLPSEAEWEYACLGGKSTRYYFGDKISSDFANYDDRFQYESEASVKYRDKTTPVGTFPPNNFGLYDMHGNVWEWCSDWHEEYPKGAVSDPSGPREGSGRVSRGGGWGLVAAFCRSASRNWYDPSFRDNRDNGFRVALSPSGIPQSPEADK